MSVEPGFGGQKFMPEVLDKMKKLRDLVDEKKLSVDIEIDGGINFNNSKKAKDYGANILVSGSTVFKEHDGNLKKNIQLLRSN
jgi:ribulose-phosphate 3-epimerase